jgi:hypothetical protein
MKLKFLGRCYPNEDLDVYRNYENIIQKKFIFNCLVRKNLAVTVNVYRINIILLIIENSEILFQLGTGKYRHITKMLPCSSGPRQRHALNLHS